MSIDVLLAQAQCAAPDGVADAVIMKDVAGVDLSWTSSEITNLWTHDTNPYFTPGTDCAAAANCTQVETGTASDSFASFRTYLLQTENICGATATDTPRLGQFQFHIVPGS